MEAGEHVKSKVANSDSNDNKEEPEASNNEELQDDDNDNSNPESTQRPQKQHHQSSPTLDETDLSWMTPLPSEEPPSSPDMLPDFHDPLSNIYNNIDQIIETSAERSFLLEPPLPSGASDSPPQGPYMDEVPDSSELPITHPTSPETDKLINDINIDVMAMEAATATPIEAMKINECMVDWLETHAGGLEEDFNKHFATLSKPQKKIYDAPVKMKKNGPVPTTFLIGFVVTIAYAI
ncbi:hypothetical protein ARMGADRAFT_1038468 [Armillaria gallica]|uniref:Uncharacterized protein n=1 Tax=Armillaria gallica TaxID=47427 RepID=A0A2H3CLD0_ARMGA|nr:hypothetical protein ARMGADRAFT_1038468 [Armillaria gallica]